MSTALDIRLVGPGGAGKSTLGALLAESLEVTFLDLDRHLAGQVGDISKYIGRHGYDAYARENIEAYCSMFRAKSSPGVIALSSGFMTYARDIHPEYRRVRRELEQHRSTFVLLPSLDRDVCVVETVRRQIARPFGRSPEEEEAVIRARFDIYMAMPMRKIETMRPVAAAVDEIVASLALDKGVTPLQGIPLQAAMSPSPRAGYSSLGRERIPDRKGLRGLQGIGEENPH